MDKDKNMYDEIARVAYGFYEKRGYTHGNDFADWLEAEKIVMKKHAKRVENNVKVINSAQQTKSGKKQRSKNMSINY